MRCPYCQKEMQRGYIPNGSQPVQWIPDGERPSVLSFSVTEQGVSLVNQFKPLKANGYKAEAHYCSDCKVASVDKGIHNKTTKYGLPTY